MKLKLGYIGKPQFKMTAENIGKFVHTHTHTFSSVKTATSKPKKGGGCSEKNYSIDSEINLQNYMRVNVGC